MARYPTVEEYNKTPAKAQTGIKKCDDFLKKSPNDIKLLTTKLQLLYIASPDSVPALLNQILQLNPPPTEVEDLTAIEDAVVQYARQGVYPFPNTAGPQVSELWEKAVKSTLVSFNMKLDLMSVRFSRAVIDNRRQDVQSTLIQLKKWAEGNKVVYLAHAAATQLLSKDTGKDVPSRLALGLAKKAVKDGFDAEKGLDCRVVGQIFALQGATEDLEGIKGNSAFSESGIAYRALQRGKEETASSNGVSAGRTTGDPDTLSPDERITVQSETLRQSLREILKTSPRDIPTLISFAADATRLFYTATHKLSLKSSRTAAQPVFLAVSALVQIDAAIDAASPSSSDNRSSYILQAAFLAEQLLAYYSQIHEAKLILVYLYQRLGLGKLAAVHYAALNIKEVQFDTVGHTLFADIAITHPHSISLDSKTRNSTGAATFNPLTVIVKQALPFYQRCEDRLADSEADILSHGQTGMIFELYELRSSLRDSVTRRLFELEHRRIAKLTRMVISDKDGAPKKLVPMPLTYWSEEVLKDTRDLNAAFNYGVSVEKLLHSSIDPRSRLLYRLAGDSVWSLASGEPTIVTDIKELLEELSNLLQTSSNEIEKLTAGSGQRKAVKAELAAAKVSCQLLQALYTLQNTPDRLLETHVGAISKAMDDLDLPAAIDSTSTSSTANIQVLFIHAESFLLTNAATTKLAQSKANPEISKAAKDLQFRSQALFDKLQSRVKELKAEITPSKIRSDLLGTSASSDSGIGESRESMASILKELNVDDFAEKTAQATKAGYESLARLKIS